MPNWLLYLIPIVVALSPGQVPMEIRPMQLEMNRVLFLARNLWLRGSEIVISDWSKMFWMAGREKKKRRALTTTPFLHLELVDFYDVRGLTVFCSLLWWKIRKIILLFFLSLDVFWRVGDAPTQVLPVPWLQGLRGVGVPSPQEGAHASQVDRGHQQPRNWLRGQGHPWVPVRRLLTPLSQGGLPGIHIVLT